MRSVTRDKYLEDQPVKTLIVIIVGILIAISGFIYSFMPVSSDNLPELQEEYYQAEEEARNLPYSHGRTVLTQRYLKASYELRYERAKSKDPTGFIAMLGLFIGATFLAVGLNIIRWKSIKDRYEPLSFDFYFGVAIGIFGMILAFGLLLIVPQAVDNVSPGNAEYYVDTFEITRKEDIVERNHTRHGYRETHDYYIYYMLGGTEIKREVQEHVYDSVKGPGTYYFLYASEGSEYNLFRVCSAYEYEIEKLPEGSADS